MNSGPNASLARMVGSTNLYQTLRTLCLALEDGTRLIVSFLNFRGPTKPQFTSACPGKPFSLNTLSMFVASVLSVLNIDAGVDEKGDAVQLNAEPTDKLIVYVVFPLRIFSMSSDKIPKYLQ